jgi:limonene-1,2-epoxide hydrolase
MRKRRFAILAAFLVLLFSVVACESTGSGGGYTPPSALELQAEADRLAAHETAIAQRTRQAMDNQARGTAEALANDAQATRQVMDAQGTAQAQAIEATRAAWEFAQTQEAANLKATRQAQDATATATSAAATATAVQWAANVQGTQYAAQAAAAKATAQAIERQEERERMTQPLRTFGPWVLLVLAVGALVFVGWQLLPIVKAQLGKFRRDERGDLPAVLMVQNGVMTLIDPTRSWGPATRLESGRVEQPLLCEPEYQDGTTKRAQFVDWRKGGRPRPVVINQQPRRALPSGAASGGQWRDITEGQQMPQLPTNVPLSSLLGSGQPSARSLALGVTMHEGGRAEIVRGDMSQLVHVAVGGSSGWGKSVFLRSLAYQLARSSEPVDLALVDLEGVTFAPFAKCGRLLYPVADTEQAALAIFQALTQEMDRRKELYSRWPGVDSLLAYNTHADEPLSPVVCLVDEATALLQDSDVESAIRTLVLRARKYGLWCVLGGQSWKASVLDTTIRDQLATRVQFKAMSASQSRVLLERSGAEQLDVPGRALAILPGRDVIEVQAPNISHHAIANALDDSGPRHELPQDSEAVQDDERAALIRELAEGGLSQREIERQVFGYTGGTAHRIVSEVLGATTTGDDGATGTCSG